MRSILALAIFITSSSANAHGRNVHRLGTLDIGGLPSECADLAVVPASARIDTPALSARVSVANCLASHAFDRVDRRHARAMIDKLDQAAAPSFALLDEVSSYGDPAWTLIAEQARGSLYAAMATRVRQALPATADDVARIDLEFALTPWLVRVDDAFSTVARIAREHPQLARNPVIANLERLSRLELQASRTRG
jgi:hypothetical protein